MRKSISATALLIAAGILASSAALADKPSWAGGGKHEKQGKHDRQDDQGDEGNGRHRGHREMRDGAYFNDDDRQIISGYYGKRAKAGHCPPGLAKKHNGCMPPGQARKWSKGHPLPADLRYHDLPRELVLRLPPPPPRHRYVQVAGDILLIAVGTNMVLDAVEDILR